MIAICRIRSISVLSAMYKILTGQVTPVFSFFMQTGLERQWAYKVLVVKKILKHDMCSMILGMSSEQQYHKVI